MEKLTMTKRLVVVRLYLAGVSYGEIAGELGYGNQNKIGDDETPASAGDVDVGGTVAQSPSAQTALVQVERYTGDVPEITAFVPPQIDG